MTSRSHIPLTVLQLRFIKNILTEGSASGYSPGVPEYGTCTALLKQGLLIRSQMTLGFTSADFTPALHALLLRMFPSFVALHDLRHASWVFAPGLYPWVFRPYNHPFALPAGMETAPDTVDPVTRVKISGRYTSQRCACVIITEAIADSLNRSQRVLKSKEIPHA